MLNAALGPVNVPGMPGMPVAPVALGAAAPNALAAMGAVLPGAWLDLRDPVTLPALALQVGDWLEVAVRVQDGQALACSALFRVHQVMPITPEGQLLDVVCWGASHPGVADRLMARMGSAVPYAQREALHLCTVDISNCRAAWPGRYLAHSFPFARKRHDMGLTESWVRFNGQAPLLAAAPAFPPPAPGVVHGAFGSGGAVPQLPATPGFPEKVLRKKLKKLKKKLKKASAQSVGSALLSRATGSSSAAKAKKKKKGQFVLQ